MRYPLLLNLYPGAKRRAFTFSFDDGVVQDRRFIELLNQHSLRGTFHLNSAFLGNENRVHADEVKSLYTNHEVASHTLTHPHLPQLSASEILREVLDDRRNLETLTGYPVRGFAYPYGEFDDRIVSILQSSGLTYARTGQIMPFDFPNTNFLRLGITSYHTDANTALEKFLTLPDRLSNQALIVLGHTYEFDHPSVGWENITALCKRASNQGTFWYPTLIELVDYTLARFRLQFSADGSIVHNPTATTIWATFNNKPIQITPRQTLSLN